MEKIDKIRILFLCTGNSCRSQMAEGWARHLKGEEIEAYSAGVNPKGIDPRAVRAMAEVGVDISTQRSKPLADVRAVPFDYVVTLCDNAHQSCPAFPGKTRVRHVGFEDPPYLARAARSKEEAMGHYRRIRDRIRAFVESLPDALTWEGATDNSLVNQGFESGIRAVLARLSGGLGAKEKE
jgi:arsenate reductase (thioredoxin)